MLPPSPFAVESIELLQLPGSLHHPVLFGCAVLASLVLGWLLMRRMRRVLRGLAWGEPAHLLRAEGAESRAAPVARALPAELVAVIGAAVVVGLESEAHIVAITSADPLAEPGYQAPAWANEGRRQHFASHKVR
ncbi:MAG: hypothetical protein IPL39_20835 [Opitutaceae bacterium]|nr:hypothetical protein [Opitutaceae bacterium]